MIKDAEENAEKDKAQRELVDTRNSAEAAVHTYQKDFDEVKDDLTEDERTKFETAVTELQESIKGEDKEDMTAKVTALHEAVAPVFAAKQKKTEATTETNDDNVVEGEVTEAA
jgi:molecular chaperone DnaK